MDEVTDPSMTVLAEGLSDKDCCGPKSYILNKIEDTCYLVSPLIGERNYIVSKHIKNRSMFHTRVRAASRIGPHNHDVEITLHPNWITGFIDAEGSFYVKVSKSKFTKVGWVIQPYFAICLHSKDLPLLQKIQYFFGTGKIDNKKNNSSLYSVGSKEDLINKIIPRQSHPIKKIYIYIYIFSQSSNDARGHFEKYPLISQKRANFLLFKDILALMSKGEHLTKEGLNKIMSIRDSLNLNKGLSYKLKESFPDISPVKLPEIHYSNSSLDPFWISGFVCGDPRRHRGGCRGQGPHPSGGFYVSIIATGKIKIGFTVNLEFSVSKNARDIFLIRSLKKYFEFPAGTLTRVPVGNGASSPKGGNIREENRNVVVYFRITRLYDILNVIIPFFTKYPSPSSEGHLQPPCLFFFINYGIYDFTSKIRNSYINKKKLARSLLIGVKRLDFKDFCEVARLMEKKEHLTIDGLERIRHIKSGMNTGREHKILSNNLIYPKIQKRTFHCRVKAGKRIGPHNIDVISVIVGSLLGDCYANRRSIEGTRLCYRQSIIHKDYLFWLYNFYFTRGYCSNLEPRMYTRILTKDNKAVTHYGYEFNTYTFRSFNWIHEMFSKKGQMYLNPKIENYLTPLALATWKMSRGKFFKEELRLDTCFRTIEDIERLTSMLRKRYGFNCYHYEYKKSYYGVGIANTSLHNFKSLVLTYTPLICH
jgi:hypothetical protein